MKFVDGFVCPLGIQQLCFESSLSVSDWAAWVQAVGSILAIAAGFFFILVQDMFARRHRRLIALAEHMETVALIDGVVNEAEALITRLLAMWPDLQSNREAVRQIAAQLSEDHRTIQALVENDIESPRLRTLLRDAGEHLDSTKNGVQRSFASYSVGKNLLMGPMPDEMAKGALIRFGKVRAELAEYDSRKRRHLDA